MREFKSVHDAHCCKIHGCKYGDFDCPVVLGDEFGIDCEDCQEEKSQWQPIETAPKNGIGVMNGLLTFLNTKIRVRHIDNGFYGPATNEFQGWNDFSVSDLYKLKMLADSALLEKWRGNVVYGKVIETGIKSKETINIGGVSYEVTDELKIALGNLKRA